MNGRGHDDDAGSHVGNTASFEDLEGMMNSQSIDEDHPDLPLDAFSGLKPPSLSVLSQEENHGILQEEYLTNESLGEILQLDGEHETSGLLNDSELLNHRGQYDSGSNLPSEDDLYEDGQHLGNGSFTDLQMYMQATPRADTSLPDLNYASDGLNDGSFGYSDDVFNHPEHFYKNNNDEHYSEGSPLEQSDQHEKAAEIFTKLEDVDRRRAARGFANDRGSSVESDVLSEGTSMELNDTVVTANGFHENIQAGAVEESYGVDPTDGKDSDSASMSIGQFVPNAVNRNRLPRPAGKPLKRSTPKTSEGEVAEHKGTPKGSLSASINRSARSSARNSPRVSGTSSQRSHRSPRYSQRSEDFTDRSSLRHSNGTDSRNHKKSSSDRRPNGVPRLNLRRDSDASSVNISLSSDPSKFDLSLRLQEESRTRRQADELVSQLQKNYDDLLGKYAQAENTIDQLKLGARVSLYSDGPAPGQSLQGSFSPAQKPGMVNFNQPQQATLHHTMSSRSHTSAGPPGGHPSSQTGHSTMGIQTNNNNIGPSGTRPLEKAETGENGFPAGEGVLMALAFQAKSLQEQVDSFGMLLQGNQIAPSEQKTVLDRLKSDQGKLEAEYMHAKEEHNALRRRNSLLSGGGDMTFDPDRALEGEIFQLGMKLEDVAEIVQNNLRNNPPPTTSPPNRQQSQESSNESRELEERLRQELERQFQKNSRHSEETSSHEDEDEQDGMEPDETQQSHHSGYSINSPQASQDSHHSAPSIFSPPQPTRQPPRQPHTTGDDRNSRRNLTEDVTGGKRHSRQSQLPRPKSLTNSTSKNIGKDPNRKPSLRNDQHGPSDFKHDHLGQSEHTNRGDGPIQKLPDNGFMSPEADSGFMGSESSRQSNQNGGGAGYDGRNQLRKPRERQSLRSSKLPHGQRSPPQVIRRVPGGDWESPQFSDYDISERDEEIEEESLRSSRAGKKSTDKTPTLRATSKANRRSSSEKQKPRPVANPPPVHSSGVQHHKQQPSHQNSRDRQPPLERSSHRRETLNKSLRNPRPAWTDYQDGSHQEPSSNSSPKKSHSTSHMRLENTVPNPVRSRPDSRQRYIPSVPLPPRRVYDSVSDVTRSSGKSEAIRDLQEEIERMKHQMENMNTPEKTRRPRVKELSSHPRPSLRSDRLDSVGSDVGSRRSEILAALQNEIADLRNQIHEQNKSPPEGHDSPLSRESLRRTRREPRQEPRQDDFEDRIVTDSLPPPRSILRETLRQQYIPRSFPEQQSFARTPTQSALPTGSPYRSRLRNPVPQFESTPYRSSPSYIPETSSYPESPPWTRPSLHPSHFASPSMRVSPGSHAAPSPVYASKSEPCPMCSGTGVHTHGEYSYPADFVGPSTTNLPQTSGLAQYEQRNHSGPSQFQAQPVVNSVPAQSFQNINIPPQMQASTNNPHHQAPSGQPSVNHQPVPNQQFVPNPQPVFIPQPVSNPTQPSQLQQAAGQQYLTANQLQPVAYQQPLLANQQQPVAFHQQPSLGQPQPQLNQTQSQPVVVPQTSAQSHQAPTAQTPSTPVPAQVHTVYTPMGNVPLVTIPVYAGMPGTTVSQSTSEKKKTKKSAQKPTREPQDTGGTTIYITPTKRRGRYYVLDDEELDSTGMEEEYYFRRTPRGSSSKGPSFMRKSRESKHAFNSSLKEAIDLEDALKMADKLNRSSHRMLSTLRADVSNSDFL